MGSSTKKIKGGRKSPLLFLKRKDKNGHNYFLDRDSGKRVKREYYQSQFYDSGKRISHNNTKIAIELFENDQIDRNQIAQYSTKFQLSDSKIKESKKGEFNGISTTFYFNAGKTISDAEESGFTIKVKKIDSNRFVELSPEKLDSEYEKFLDLANEIEEIENKGKEKGNPTKIYPTFMVEYDIINKIVYLDFDSLNRAYENADIIDILDNDSEIKDIL